MSDSPVRAPRIVLLGPPASGKGTQGRRLASSLELAYLSTGALLREQVRDRTDLGRLAEPILARGAYLPDDLMCRIIADWLGRQSGGWVLDGFPRSVPQAEFLDTWLGERGDAVDAAIALQVPIDELRRRIRSRVECPECHWSGQGDQAKGDGRCPVCSSRLLSRSDDTEENFNQRHAEFERLTLPVLERYGSLGRLFCFDATVPQEELAAILVRHLKP